MIPCRHCLKSHRDQDKVDACGVRKEKRLAREAEKQADVERRLAVQKTQSVEEFIKQCVRRGIRFETMVARLNRDYPVREQGKYTLYEVVEIDSRNLNWPTDLETTTLLRLERIVTGDYLSTHPLALPVDGSYSLVGKVA